MAKLPRTTQKIFGKNAPENQITTFGSIKAGTPVYTQSASQIMNSAFEGGWSEAVEDDYAPYRQDRNAVDTAITQQLAYLFQDGIPEWDAGTTYYKGSVVKVVNGNALTFYKSIADNNTASVNTTASWHKMLEINASNQIVSPTINTPTISGGSMSNGTFSDPTFSGTVNIPLASQSSSTDSTIAASIGWVNNPSLSSNVLHKTGTETATGEKTFNSIKVADRTAGDSTENAANTKFVTTALTTLSTTLTNSINTVNNNAVHKTGNETVGGVKTLTSNLELTSSFPSIRENNTAITVGTAPSSNNNLHMVIHRDSNDKGISSILSYYNTNKDVHTRICAYKSNASTDTADTYLRVYYTADGHYGISVSSENVGTDTNDSLVNSTTSTTNTTVPCMGWVNSRLNNTKGNVTINGATNLTSSISLGSKYTFGASGLLVLTIRVTGQTGPTVEVRMSDTNNASASSQIVTIFGENGGSAEYFQGPLTFPIKKGNSIYLNKTGTGSATIEKAYLFDWNNS